MNKYETLVRQVCASQGMPQEDTEKIVAICWAESGMNPLAVHHNTNGSLDWGLNQWNDRYWIGVGKLFPSTEYVLNNPDQCVIKQCNFIKKNPDNYKMWCSYTNGLYLRYLKSPSQPFYKNLLSTIWKFIKWLF